VEVVHTTDEIAIVGAVISALRTTGAEIAS
jgi:hypothetical protein